MKLFEIKEEIESCIIINDEQAVTGDGELIDIKALEELQLDFDEKLENLGRWVKNLAAEEAACKAQKDAFYKREKAAKKKGEDLKLLLARLTDGKKKTFDSCVISTSSRKGEIVPLTYSPGADVPDEFKKAKTTYDWNKDALRKAFEGSDDKKIAIALKYAWLDDRPKANVK